MMWLRPTRTIHVTQRARLRPVRIESPIDLQENLLSQILGLIKSSGEAICQVVNPLVVLANYGFPGAMVAGQAPFHQFRIGCLQPVVLAPSLRYRYLI